DGTHSLAVGSVNPGLFHRTGRSDRQRRGCHKAWARPTDRLAGQHEAASAESEVRPGPRPPTLRTRDVEAGEAGPEARPKSSLPIRVQPCCTSADLMEFLRLRQLQRAAAL